MVNVPPVSHADIIENGGGPAAVAKTITEYEGSRGRPPVDANTSKAWKRLNSIPSGYWEAFAATELATYDALAAAAAMKRAPAVA